MEDLAELQVYKLTQQLREKEARIARLQKACDLLIAAKPYNTEGVHKAVAIRDETPQQSAAHIQAEAVEQFAEWMFADNDSIDTNGKEHARHYANQLRQQADKG